MPLKLKPPRQGKTPYWSVRGTYLKVHVDRTTGVPDEATAAKVLRAIKAEIESGAFSKRSEPNFASAALAYVKAGGERRFILKLADHFGETPLRKITQEAIDDAALELYPNVTPATRNRQVHTVVSAVLKHARVDYKLSRPKGSNGAPRIVWLREEQAFPLLDAARERDAEFGVFVTTLLYTGMRLSEATAMEIDRLDLKRAFAYVPTTKNGKPRGVHLPPIVVAALANHPRGLGRRGERIFRFTKSSRLYAMLDDALAVAGVVLPPGTGFHVLRHTWATWMRRHGGLDTTGLVATGAWKSRAAAARYEHTDVREEAGRADLLPVPPGPPSSAAPAAEQTRGKSVERPSKLVKTA
jgi:integrase